MPDTVKLLPDLFPAAHKRGEGQSLRVWLLARALCVTPGKIKHADLLAGVIKHCQVTRRYAAKLIAEGDQQWWAIDPKHGDVYLFGARRMAVRLGVTYSEAPAVLLPFTDLQPIGHFYALCYAAYMQRFVHGDTSTIIPRATLQAIFGVTKNGLLAWEKKARVKVVSNHAFAAPSAFREMPQRYIEYHCECGQPCRSLEELYAHRRQTGCQKEHFTLVWDRPNNYLPPTLPTTGTASPICRSRMTHYLERRSRNPMASDVPNHIGTATQSLTHTTGDVIGWLDPGRKTHYEPAKVSDNIPAALLHKGLARLYRACYAQN